MSAVLQLTYNKGTRANGKILVRKAAYSDMGPFLYVEAAQKS